MTKDDTSHKRDTQNPYSYFGRVRTLTGFGTRGVALVCMGLMTIVLLHWIVEVFDVQLDGLIWLRNEWWDVVGFGMFPILWLMSLYARAKAGKRLFSREDYPGDFAIAIVVVMSFAATVAKLASLLGRE